MKIIAIQDNLEYLKKDLENYGYKVIYSSQINSPVDAYIYYEENNTKSLLTVNQQLNNIFSMSSSFGSESNSSIQSSYGTLLINAKNKTTEEIHQIITNRTYSPLF